jgi:hypothetical protein
MAARASGLPDRPPHRLGLGSVAIERGAPLQPPEIGDQVVHSLDLVGADAAAQVGLVQGVASADAGLGPQRLSHRRRVDPTGEPPERPRRAVPLVPDPRLRRPVEPRPQAPGDGRRTHAPHAARVAAAHRRTLVEMQQPRGAPAVPALVVPGDGGEPAGVGDDCQCRVGVVVPGVGDLQGELDAEHVAVDVADLDRCGGIGGRRGLQEHAVGPVLGGRCQEQPHHRPGRWAGVWQDAADLVDESAQRPSGSGPPPCARKRQAEILPVHQYDAQATAPVRGVTKVKGR